MREQVEFVFCGVKIASFLSISNHFVENRAETLATFRKNTYFCKQKIAKK